MTRIVCTLLIVLVAGSVGGFAEMTNHPSATTATIVVDGTTVTYVGKIYDQNVARFLEAVTGKKITVLVIASSGGEVNAGMKLGDWVFDNRVNVVVDRMCMSSCANYVFTAGRHKTIRANAIVAWHGSILQELGISDADVRASATEAYQQLPASEQAKCDVEEWIRQAIRQMQEYRVSTMARQQQFFQKIGVDEYLCRVGSEKGGAKDFFALSVPDMARFGVGNVLAPENYEKTDLTPFRQTGKSVEFIKLP